MTTRQPLNSRTRLDYMSNGHYFELTFRPDQRVLAWLAVEHWWNERIITRDEYLIFRAAVRENTWEENQ